jgi:hypothetical protein
MNFDGKGDTNMTTQVLSTLRTQFKRSPIISLTLAAILVLSLGIWVTLSNQPTAASRTGITRAAQAEAARYTGLAEQYQARGRVIQAEIGRLNGQAQAYFEQHRAVQVEIDRLNAQAQAYHRQRALKAETDRLNAEAKAYLSSQGASPRSLEAWAARYTAQAEAYLKGK